MQNFLLKVSSGMSNYCMTTIFNQERDENELKMNNDTIHLQKMLTYCSKTGNESFTNVLWGENKKMEEEKCSLLHFFFL